MNDDMQSRIAAVQRMAAEVEAEVVSEHGEVRVVAGPGGEVRAIDLRLGAYELSGVELGEVTTATAKAATAQADRELSERIRGLLSGFFEAEREETR